MKKLISLLFVVILAFGCFSMSSFAETSYNTKGTRYTKYTQATLQNKRKDGSVTFVITRLNPKSQAKVKLTDVNNNWLWESSLSTKNKNYQTFCTLNLGKNHSAYRIWFRNIYNAGQIGILYLSGKNVNVY